MNWLPDGFVPTHVSEDPESGLYFELTHGGDVNHTVIESAKLKQLATYDAVHRAESAGSRPTASPVDVTSRWYQEQLGSGVLTYAVHDGSPAFLIAWITVEAMPHEHNSVRVYWDCEPGGPEDADQRIDDAVRQWIKQSWPVGTVLYRGKWHEGWHTESDS